MARPAAEAAPLTGAEFHRLMRRVGPFEPKPRLAVGCSGGSDSTALLHLAVDWAEEADGSVVALVVDHGLRPESAAEALHTSEMARRAGAEAVILTRKGAPPAANTQEVAREARYRLMTDWCAAAGVLHLLLAHHRDDQAETLLLRLARGSGVDGLAAMAPVSELAELRLIRPLLDVPRARLQAFLDERRLPAIADPSNENDRFDRVRMRKALPPLAAIGLGVARLAGTAARLGRAREALEREAVRILAEAVEVFPEGYALFTPGALLEAPEEIALRVLSRTVALVGGRRHPPRLDRVERLYERLLRGEIGGGRTLAGCCIRPAGGRLLVCRESEGIEDAVPASGRLVWDGRFRIDCESARPGAELRKLGASGWRQVAADRPALRASVVPSPVRETLPAVWDLEGVSEVPHLCYVRAEAQASERTVRSIAFAPVRSVQVTRFTRHEQAVNTV